MRGIINTAGVLRCLVYPGFTQMTPIEHLLGMTSWKSAHGNAQGDS